MPLFGMVRMWAFGLLAVALWAAAAALAYGWSRRLPDPPPPPPAGDARPAEADRPAPPPTFADRLTAWRPAADLATAFLGGAAALALLGAGGGRWLALLALPRRADNPRHERAGEPARVRRPDGTELHVEVSGDPAGPTVVLTHGWGASATEWFHLRRRLGGRYRLVAWDLPGLGLSKAPASGDFSLPKLADDLRAVLDAAGGPGPAVLLGHSIGGMITLTLCQRHPDLLGGRVAGLALVHTTHTNPVRTTRGRSVLLPLQRPVLEPLAYLMIGLAPVVWAMNLLSYLNGSAHLSNYRQLFSGACTRGQLEWATRYVLQVWPATYARGMLGMMRTYHATDALPGIGVPTLVVAADRDRLCEPDASRTMCERMPRAESATLSPAGHMGLISSHDEFGRAADAFLGRCLGATPATAGAEGRPV
jgi:pimeloyl-ACP methyl ester carboxylesterase